MHRPLEVVGPVAGTTVEQLGVRGDCGERCAQLVGHVGDEAAHPLPPTPAARASVASRSSNALVDPAEHRVERRGEPTDLGASVAAGHLAIEVTAAGDRQGGLLDLAQRAQADTHEQPSPQRRPRRARPRRRSPRSRADGGATRRRRGATGRRRARCRRTSRDVRSRSSVVAYRSAVTVEYAAGSASTPSPSAQRHVVELDQVDGRAGSCPGCARAGRPSSGRAVDASIVAGDERCPAPRRSTTSSRSSCARISDQLLDRLVGPLQRVVDLAQLRLRDRRVRGHAGDAECDQRRRRTIASDQPGAQRHLVPRHSSRRFAQHVADEAHGVDQRRAVAGPASCAGS